MLAGEITLTVTHRNHCHHPRQQHLPPSSPQGQSCPGSVMADCSRIWSNKTGSPLPLASKISLKPAKIYEPQAVRKLGIRPGRIGSDLWELRHGRDELCSCPSLLSIQTAQAPSSCPPGCQGRIAEQRLLELAGGRPERRGRQREERTLHMGREAAGATVETLHSGDIIYRTQRDLVSNSH